MSAEHTLAQLVATLRAAARGGTKPVFWLGAGCSVYDGVPLNAKLLELILAGQPPAWGSPQFAFDRYLETLDEPTRAAIFREHLERPLKHDSPYLQLAALLRDGFIDTVFTFNIDGLLDKAMKTLGLSPGSDYADIDAVMLAPGAVDTMLRSAQPRIRVVKLHGGHAYGLNLMTSSEIVRYQKQIEPLVREYSRKPAVVCGYSFFHLNVLTAFSADGATMFYVNRMFPDAPMVLSLMEARSKRQFYYIDGDLGTFEVFSRRLAAQLGISP